MNGSRSFAGGPTSASIASGLATKQTLWTTTAIKTGTYTAAPWELVRCDATGGSFTVTLPSASTAGQQVAVKLLATSGTNTVTVSRAGSDTINAAGTSVTLTLTDEAVVFTSSGAGVWTIAEGRVTTISLDARYPPYVGAPSVPADRSFIAWAYPPYAAAGSTALSSAGVVYLTRLRRVPAGSITNINIVISVVGSGLTTGQCFAGLWTAAGAKIAVTADQAANWTTGIGLKTMALAGGAYTHAGGDLYAGMWYNGTTGPTVMRLGQLAGMTNVGLAAPNLQSATANTSITTSAPDPLGSQASVAFEYWFALS